MITAIKTSCKTSAKLPNTSSKIPTESTPNAPTETPQNPVAQKARKASNLSRLALPQQKQPRGREKSLNNLAEKTTTIGQLLQLEEDGPPPPSPSVPPSLAPTKIHSLLLMRGETQGEWAYYLNIIFNF